MAELPRGTVTFLFTDIEGSTRLLKQLGPRYAELIEAHHRILRKAAAEREGHELDNQGDSFLFVFARANAALAAAVVAQRALAAQEWPEGVEVRVRMGLHTGEPAVGPERYVGLGVHRAARIGAAAHGGQVLLSGATRELVEDELGGVSVRELGTYRLKDIDQPERLFQVEVEGLPRRFPPLAAEKVVWSPLRRRALLLPALAGVVAAAVAIPIFALGQGGGGAPPVAAAGDSVAFLDPNTNRLVADVPVGAIPSAVTAGASAVWVANTADDTVDQIDPETHTIRQTIRVGDGPSGIAFGDDSLWIANGLSRSVWRIDPVTHAVVAKIPVGNDPAGIVYAAGSIWVANTGDDTITRIDVATDRPAKPLDIAATELAYGDGSLWASDRSENRVVRIDPRSGEVVAPIAVGNGPTGIAFGGSAVWVLNSLDGTIWRIDPDTNAVAAAVPVGDGATAVAADAGGVWVSQRDGTIVHVDPSTNALSRPIAVGGRPQNLALSAGSVLVTVGQTGAGHRGGTLTVASGIADFGGSVDSAVVYDTNAWLYLRMTGDGLVAFDQTSGVAGTQLVPDLAVSLPTPADGGRTYTFRLRANVRYSTGRPVEASDVRATFERDFAVGKLPVDYYDGIVGAAQCKRAPKSCDLSRGIVANDAARTVTFHLVAPDPEFPYKLALPFAHVLPSATPAHELKTRPLPATGPYAIASYRPGHTLELVRNRYFRVWSQAAQPAGYPDRIAVELGQSADQAVKAVIAGQADVFASIGGAPSRALLTQLETRFASRVHSDAALQTSSLFLNTRSPPFDNLDARRALNYAVDREAAVAIAGGPDLAQATCQILPPGMPGYRHYCPYETSLARARALVAASGTRGAKVSVIGPTWEQGYSVYAAKLLRSLGYRVSLKLVSGPQYFSYVFRKVQVGFFPWSADYPVASSFLEPILSCAAFKPGNPGASTNFSRFCDPRIDGEIRQAVTELASDPQAARRLWASIDRQAVDQAPMVPLVSTKLVTVLSKRTGNFQYNPMWTVLFDQLWVR